MKHKIGIILLVFVLAMTFVVNVNAQNVIKEDASKYEGDVYIIGSSKFDNNVIVTGTMAGVAGAREAVLQYQIYGNQEFDPESIIMYHYCGEDGTWNILPRTTEDEYVTLNKEVEEDAELIEEITENLNVYYVNDEVKTLEIPYDVDIKDGYELGLYIEGIGNIDEDDVIYKDGKLILPATVTYLETSLVNKEQPEDIIILDSIEQTESAFENKTVAVKTLAELKQAIADEKEDIRLVADIVDITETITIPYQVYFNGAGHKLAFKDIKKTEGNNTASGLVIAANYSTVTDLTIEMDDKEGWDANYALQVYGAPYGVTIVNYTGTKADAALLVNGSNVSIFGKINVSGNESGGIEVSKGADPSLMPSWLNIGTNITMTDEATGKPIIWVENAQGNVGYAGEVKLLEPNGDIPAAAGKTQVYYYSSREMYTNIGVTTPEELALALQLPCTEKITLLNDIELPAGVEIRREITLDLNGKTLKAKSDMETIALITVLEMGMLTVEGNGTINSASQGNDYSMAIWAKENGYVEIKNGTFTNVGAKSVEDNGTTPNNNELIYVSGNGRIVINGGKFIGNTENEKWGTYYTLNAHDDSFKAGAATIEVRGGTYVAFNPAHNKAEGENTCFVNYGYKVVEKDGEYTVLEIDENDVAMCGRTAYNDLQTAINEAPADEFIFLLKDIELATGLEVRRPVMLDLNEKTLKAKSDMESLALITVLETGTLVVAGNGTVNSASQGNDYSMAIWAKGNGYVEINGGTFTNVGAKSVEDDGVTANNNELIYVSGNGKVVINDGKFIGNTENEKWGTYYTLNAHDDSFKAGTATIEVRGGTYVLFNPADNKAEGEGTNFVANGFVVNVNGDEYTVVYPETQN